MLQPPTRLLLYILTPLALALTSPGRQGGPPEAAATQIRQWASSATASSEGANTPASQATGPPNTESCGFHPTAWGQVYMVRFGVPKNWIELTYATPVHAVRVRARETNAPGSVVQVDLRDVSGTLHTVWTGSDKTECLDWFEVEIPRTPYLVSGVKLYTKKLKIEQIDAVELIGELQATLSISAAPPGSQVFLDGKPAGATAADGSFSATVLPGSHQVRLTAAGYPDWAQDVTLKADSTVNLEARMALKTADLTLLTQPGQAQVYLDDEPRGVTSSEGRLLLKNLSTGAHRLRLSLTGYKEWTQTLELAAGDTKQVEAKLQPAGLKPLGLAEIEDALKNGLPNARVTTLVKEFGVDFAVTDEVEKRLRAAGADSDLLLAIMKAKK